MCTFTILPQGRQQQIARFFFSPWAHRGLVEGGRYGSAKTVKTADIRSLGAQHRADAGVNEIWGEVDKGGMRPGAG
jgi:hypothetical protein